MSASARPFVGAKKIQVTFERREDGGLRVHSAALPGFVLSHSEARLVLADVEPALSLMLSEMYSIPMVVEPLTDLATELESAGIIDPLLARPETREYVARRAA
jgi:hypothetical protein